MRTRAFADVMMCCVMAQGASIAQPPAIDQRGREFIQLCDVACAELNTPERKVPFYHDSYAVRALAVAHDITGGRKYLDVCRRWSDRMVEHQNAMTPKGAYWMHYGRKPNETTGEWYVADCASIAMGVLATAVRCEDEAERKRFMASVGGYSRLVMENYVRPSGGITDGIWSKFDGEWWCSTGIFGSLAFLLYAETGDEAYLNVAMGAVDWLNRMGFRRAEHIGFDEAAPAVVMYVFEAFSAGMPYLCRDARLEKASTDHVTSALEWMTQNQQGRGAKSAWDYNKQWGCKMGGMPFHQYIYARHLPGGAAIAAAADQELDYIARRIFSGGKPGLTQLACFAMMSYAEKIRPGAVYRTTLQKR